MEVDRQPAVGQLEQPLWVMRVRVSLDVLGVLTVRVVGSCRIGRVSKATFQCGRKEGWSLVVKVGKRVSAEQRERGRDKNQR